jgi:hypothetical protein
MMRRVILVLFVLSAVNLGPLASFAVGEPLVTYVYDTDAAARDAFVSLLEDAGFVVNTVSMADVGNAALAPTELIIIGYDTGLTVSWGTPEAVANVVGAAVPIVGISQGGGAFFHQLPLYMEWDNCAGTTASTVVVEDASHPMWNVPVPIPVAPDESVQLYANSTYAVSLYLAAAPPTVTCYGFIFGNLGYCGLASERWSGSAAYMWSFDGPPADMSAAGQDLFTNLVWFAHSTLMIDGFESGDTTIWSETFPEPPTCGNGILEWPEVCDGDDLGGQTCQSQGFDGGDLACEPDCTGFDVSGCTACGNGILEWPEVCDGDDLGGQTCLSQGFDGGDLACEPDCSGFDVSGCF